MNAQPFISGYEDVRLDECFVYHWFDSPDGKTIPGIWDLRKDWREYLGDPHLRGRNVLEIGPASGFLTFKMEGEGANVVCFDVAPNVSPDVTPTPGLDYEESANNSRVTRIRFALPGGTFTKCSAQKPKLFTVTFTGFLMT